MQDRKVWRIKGFLVDYKRGIEDVLTIRFYLNGVKGLKAVIYLINSDKTCFAFTHAAYQYFKI